VNIQHDTPKRFRPSAFSLHPSSFSLHPKAHSLIFLKILLEFYQAKTPVTTQIMINTICSRIFCHGRRILKIIEKILGKVYLGIPELLDTLALIHNVGVKLVGAKVIVLEHSTKYYGFLPFHFSF
jgi:hypothetical protein